MDKYNETKETEKELILIHKKELDKANKRPLILAEKCPICNKVHPKVKFYWNKSTIDGFPSLRIKILVPDDSFLKQVYEAERMLNNIGIHFDTGYGNARDWESDWSLYGEHYLFNEETKKYEQIVRGDMKIYEM